MQKLVRGLRDFQSNYFCQHQELFESLAHGQKPRVLFITCSDSRVDPNLITQSEIGELFVIRNAGNIIPPFGAANGGEGAAIEYAIHALSIDQIIVCGHSNCGAMKGLIKMEKLRDEMPLVYQWLQHAEATRRLLKENYGDREGDDLIETAIAENVLTQLENLRTYPVIHARLAQSRLTLHGWIYHIDRGIVMAYSPETHDFELVEDSVPICNLPTIDAPYRSHSHAPSHNGQTHNGSSWLAPEQLDRIYRGSYSTR